MKKLSRIAALLAAGALLFGAFGCSDDDNEEKDPPKPQTETVSYTLEDDTPGFDSGSLKVSGMNTTEDTSDDTFEMTLTPKEGTAVTVTGTWKLNDGSTTEFTCKSDKSVEINGVPVTPDTVVTGTMNGDTISLSIPIETTSVTLTFVKDEDKSTPTVTGALTGTWTALDYKPSDTNFTSNDKEKGRAVSDGAKLGAVTMKGEGAVWKVDNKENPTAWKYLETGKKESGCLEFTIAATSKIVVNAQSGNSAGSDIALCKDIGGANTVTGSATTVTNSATDVIYDNVPAGTYYLGAYPASTLNRGVRILSITVTAK